MTWRGANLTVKRGSLIRVVAFRARPWRIRTLVTRILGSIPDRRPFRGILEKRPLLLLGRNGLFGRLHLPLLLHFDFTPHVFRQLGS